MSDRPVLPHPKVTTALSLMVVVLSFVLTIYVIEKGKVTDEALGMVLNVWLGCALVSVVGFWFGTSVGGRLNSSHSVPMIPVDKGGPNKETPNDTRVGSEIGRLSESFQRQGTPLAEDTPFPDSGNRSDSSCLPLQVDGENASGVSGDEANSRPNS